LSLTTKLRIYYRKHENVLCIIGINVGSARSGIYSVVRLQAAVCQFVILKVISFDRGLDVAQAVDGRFLSQQRPYRVTFVLVITGFTVSRIIFHFSCVVCRIGVGRNVIMNKRYICNILLLDSPACFGPLCHGQGHGERGGRGWLRHCTTSRKVAVSIPDIFIILPAALWPSGRLSL